MTVTISILAKPTPDGMRCRVLVPRRARGGAGRHYTKTHAAALQLARLVTDAHGNPPAQILTLEPAARYLARHPEIEAPAN